MIPWFCNIPQGLRLTPERLAKLDIGDEITIEERLLFKEMLLNREKAIAFKWKECRQVYKDVSLPIIIKTVLYKVWQSPGIVCSKVLYD